jgi:ornithine--oxo-acid transaminase
VLASKDILGVFHPGDHGSTFGGNPLACAIARASLRALVDEKMVENSAELGAYFLARLREIKSPCLKQVRGVGLWIGVEMTGPARPYCEKLKEEGILCKETHERVIRFAPPLVITKDEIDWAVVRIKTVIEGQ